MSIFDNLFDERCYKGVFITFDPDSLLNEYSRCIDSIGVEPDDDWIDYLRGQIEGDFNDSTMEIEEDGDYIRLVHCGVLAQCSYHKTTGFLGILIHPLMKDIMNNDPMAGELMTMSLMAHEWWHAKSPIFSRSERMANLYAKIRLFFATYKRRGSEGI